jgi:hypothetical protein
LARPWIAALTPLPFAVLLRLTFHGPWIEIGSAALYLAGYFLAWRIFGLDQSDRAVLDQLFKRKSAVTPAATGGD